MLLVKLVRAFAPLLVLVATQVGIYLILRELFAPRPEHARRRRWILGALIGLGAWLPIFFILGKAGFEAPPPIRWMAQPLLAHQMLSIPVLLLLGAALSLAHRVHRRARGKRAAAEAQRQPPVSAPVPVSTPVPGKDPGHGQPGHEHHLIEELPPLPEPRRIFLARAATGLFGIAGLATVVGIHDAEAAPLISRHDVPIPNLHPDLEGLTVAHLSDVHAGMLMTEERMRRIARTAAALQPDVVALTGDLLDMSLHAAGPFSRAFRELHGKLGTFAVLGNHDYYAGSGAAVRAVQDAGGLVLRNAGQRVVRGNGSIWFAGIDDPLAVDAGGTVDPDQALHGAAPNEPKVMLAHRPSLFEDCADAGADLVLSGHTHGGQIALGRTWSAARLLGPYTMGFYGYEGSKLFVHRGLGVVAGMPLRLGSRPEIVLLTLRRS